MTTANVEAEKTIVQQIIDELEKKFPEGSLIAKLTDSEFSQFGKLYDRVCKYDNLLIKLNHIKDIYFSLNKIIPRLKEIDLGEIAETLSRLEKLNNMLPDSQDDEDDWDD